MAPTMTHCLDLMDKLKRMRAKETDSFKRIDTKMPVMPRNNKKATAIAYSILGKPANFQKSSSKQYKHTPVQRGGYSELERSIPVRIPIR